MVFLVYAHACCLCFCVFMFNIKNLNANNFFNGLYEGESILHFVFDTNIMVYAINFIKV